MGNEVMRVIEKLDTKFGGVFFVKRKGKGEVLRGPLPVGLLQADFKAEG